MPILVKRITSATLNMDLELVIPVFHKGQTKLINTQSQKYLCDRLNTIVLKNT